MNSSVINSSPPFNHSSSGSSLELLNAYKGCITSLGEYSLQFTVKIINLVVGYPANIMVMWLVARKKSDSSTSNIFIFNLAIADACFCLMTPINLVGYLIFEYIYKGYIPYIWEFQNFIYGIKNTTPLFLTCICLDRYVAVVHPIVFTSMKDNNIRLAISMLVWGLIIAFSVSRTLWLNLTGNIFTGLILVVFAIMVFCNVSIMWSLRKSVLGKEKMHPMKKKALRTVQITLAIIVFHYLPVVAIMPFRNKRDFPEFCQVQMIVFALMNVSSSTEPLLYISKMTQLPGLNNFLCICCRSPSRK